MRACLSKLARLGLGRGTALTSRLGSQLLSDQILRFEVQLTTIRMSLVAVKVHLISLFQ